MEQLMLTKKEDIKAWLKSLGDEADVEVMLDDLQQIASFHNLSSDYEAIRYLIDFYCAMNKALFDDTFTRELLIDYYNKIGK